MISRCYQGVIFNLTPKFFFYALFLIIFCFPFKFLSVFAQVPCLRDSIILNTGYSSISNTTYSFGQQDPLWVVVLDALPNTSEPRPSSVIQKHPNWSGPFPNSQWIAVYNSYINNTNGLYVYERCFCAQQSGRIKLRLEILADDTVGVYFNGNYLKGSTTSGSFVQFITPLIIDTILSIVQGKNCIRLEVGNVYAVAHGLNVRGSVRGMMPFNFLLADTCCNQPFIVGQKINDLNCNGLIDFGEPPLPNWSIIIAGTNFIDTVTTGSDGSFTLQLPPGCYKATEIAQSGWAQTYPTTPQQICVNFAQIGIVNFLNCQKPPCDTIGLLQLDSACCRLTIPVFNLASGPMTQIQWAILNNSGTMEEINIMGCSYNLVPPNPYGTTSGVINFPGAGCQTNPTLIIEVNPLTSNGIVTIAFAFWHKDKVCRDTIQVKCSRAPLVKCDSLTVKPFNWSVLNLSGRTFKIFNLKQPSSPICSIKVSLVPDPNPANSTFKWNGGGLVIDGGPRSWGVANSGIPYYSTIICTGVGSPQGNSANSYVQFNLGVDYTLNWVGKVVLTIIHCDGDTCVLTYDNWCAKPPGQCIVGTPIQIDSIKPPKLVSGVVEFDLKESDKIKYAKIVLSEKSIRNNVQILGAIAVLLDKNRNIAATANTFEYSNFDTIGKHFAVVEFSDVFKSIPRFRPGSELGVRLLSLFMTKGEDDTTEITFDVILFDDSVNPIGIGTFRARQLVSNVNFDKEIYLPYGILNLFPNPANAEVLFEFFSPSDGNSTIEIFDLLGNKVRNVVSGFQSFGLQRLNVSVSDLPAGYYNVVFRMPNGSAISKPLLINR